MLYIKTSERHCNMTSERCVIGDNILHWTGIGKRKLQFFITSKRVGKYFGIDILFE